MEEEAYNNKASKEEPHGDIIRHSSTCKHKVSFRNNLRAPLLRVDEVRPTRDFPPDLPLSIPHDPRVL